MRSAAMSAPLFGDFSAVAAGLPAVLTPMQYSRAMELEPTITLSASCAATARHRTPPRMPVGAGTGHAGPARRAVIWMKRSLTCLSTHPATEERIARLRAASSGSHP